MNAKEAKGVVEKEINGTKYKFKYGMIAFSGLESEFGVDMFKLETAQAMEQPSPNQMIQLIWAGLIKYHDFEYKHVMAIFDEMEDLQAAFIATAEAIKLSQTKSEPEKKTKSKKPKTKKRVK